MTIYHIYETINPRWPRPGQPRLLSEEFFCDDCWHKGGQLERYKNDHGAKNHKVFEGADNEQCDMCRPVEV